MVSIRMVRTAPIPEHWQNFLWVGNNKTKLLSLLSKIPLQASCEEGINLWQPFSKMATMPKMAAMTMRMHICNEPTSKFLLNILTCFYHNMNNRLLYGPTIHNTLTLTFTFRLVTHQLEAVVAAATEGSVEVGAVVLTAAIVSQTLVHVWKIKVRHKVAIASLLLSIVLACGCC